MKKLIVIVGIVAAVIAAALVGFRMYTKSFSPRDTASFNNDNVTLNISYGRPYKKGRTIFDGLVPFDKVWRTGANEPTIFTTNVDLRIGDEVLKKGKYSLFTVPGRESWEIIFNNAIPSWGVDFQGNAARDESEDALTLEVAAINTKNRFEQFTIAFEEMHEEIDIVLMWDQTLVVVPMAPMN